MRWLMAVAVLAVGLVRVDAAAACSCNLFLAELGAAQRQLPREATLYVWTNPTYVEGPVAATVTLDGNAIPFELESVLAASRYHVHRLRIHAPAAGELSVTVATPSDHDVTELFDVVDEPTPSRPLQLESAEFQRLPMPWCGGSGWYLTFDGEAPAAYRLRGTFDGHAVDAYLPPGSAFDDDSFPRKGFHGLTFSVSTCGEWWLDPDLRLPPEPGTQVNEAHWDDVVLSRLELDGTEVEVARGDLSIGGRSSTLPAFDAPAWPEPPPPPPPVVPPARAIAWWPVGAGAGGGLVLGGLGWLGLARRRRPR